jgi:hypothetical protein
MFYVLQNIITILHTIHIFMNFNIYDIYTFLVNVGNNAKNVMLNLLFEVQLLHFLDH